MQAVYKIGFEGIIPGTLLGGFDGLAFSARPHSFVGSAVSCRLTRNETGDLAPGDPDIFENVIRHFKQPRFSEPTVLSPRKRLHKADDRPPQTLSRLHEVLRNSAFCSTGSLR